MKKCSLKRLKLKQGIKTLQTIKELDQVTFWGRIIGLKKNYNILMSFDFKGDNFFPKLNFYWSDSLLEFSPLPELELSDKEILSSKNGYLSGEHDKLVHSFEKTDDYFDPNDFESIIKKGNQKQNLKEIHRVSFLVEQITKEGAVFPKEAFFIDFNNNLDFERNFRMTRDQAYSLDNYRHFWKPEEKKINKYLSLRRDKNIELFDRIETQKYFNLGKDFTGSKVNIKSMLWPGLVSCYRTNSPHFGFLYFGHGLKNKDIEFLLNK